MSIWFPGFQRRHTIFVVGLLTLALAVSAFVPSPPLAMQLTILGIAVVVFGLPHGALDLALVQGVSRGSWTALTGAVAVYLVVSGAVLVAWITAPIATLFAFLAIAVIHFGSGDTEDLRGAQRAVEVVARGGFAGIAPLAFHPQTTRDLFALLVGPSSIASLDGALALVAPPATWLWITCLAVAVIWRVLQRAPGWLLAVAELSLTAALFAVFHPLAAFLLYFCFVHSVRHIADLGAARFPDSVSRARRWLLLESLPFTATTVMLGAIAWTFFARSTDFDAAMMRVIFWGLSALTLPHMILTAWWHARGAPQPGNLFARHI
jgi:Brp/Blh family beta-carotene 15,15'-monooxygenase